MPLLERCFCTVFILYWELIVFLFFWFLWDLIFTLFGQQFWHCCCLIAKGDVSFIVWCIWHKTRINSLMNSAHYWSSEYDRDDYCALPWAVFALYFLFISSFLNDWSGSVLRMHIGIITSFIMPFVCLSFYLHV